MKSGILPDGRARQDESVVKLTRMAAPWGRG